MAKILVEYESGQSETIEIPEGEVYRWQEQSDQSREETLSDLLHDKLNTTKSEEGKGPFSYREVIDSQ